MASHFLWLRRLWVPVEVVAGKWVDAGSNDASPRGCISNRSEIVHSGIGARLEILFFWGLGLGGRESRDGSDGPVTVSLSTISDSAADLGAMSQSAVLAPGPRVSESSVPLAWRDHVGPTQRRHRRTSARLTRRSSSSTSDDLGHWRRRGVRRSLNAVSVTHSNEPLSHDGGRSEGPHAIGRAPT
jgi:hypothetical protein